MKKLAILFLATVLLVAASPPAFASHGYVNSRVCWFGGSTKYLDSNSYYSAPWTFDFIAARGYHYKKVSGSWSYVDMGYDVDATLYQRAHVGHSHSPNTSSFKTSTTHSFSHTDSSTIYYKYTSAIDACL